MPTLVLDAQVDPVEGGSANDYDYVSGDPVNNFDLDGTRSCKWNHPSDCGKAVARRAKKVRGFAVGAAVTVAAGTRRVAGRVAGATGRGSVRLGRGAAGYIAGAYRCFGTALDMTYNALGVVEGVAFAGVFGLESLGGSVLVGGAYAYISGRSAVRSAKKLPGGVWL